MTQLAGYQVKQGVSLNSCEAVPGSVSPCFSRSRTIMAPIKGCWLQIYCMLVYSLDQKSPKRADNARLCVHVPIPVERP